jgi:hypothetical protein
MLSRIRQMAEGAVSPQLVLGLGVVLILGLVSFLTDVSSEMIYPLLPLFLTTVLGAGPANRGQHLEIRRVHDQHRFAGGLLQLSEGLVSRW